MIQYILLYTIISLVAILVMWLIVDFVTSLFQVSTWSVTQLEAEKTYQAAYRRGLRFKNAMTIRANAGTTVFVITVIYLSGREKQIFEVYTENGILIYRAIVRNAKSLIELED